MGVTGESKSTVIVNALRQVLIPVQQSVRPEDIGERLEALEAIVQNNVQQGVLPIDVQQIEAELYNKVIDKVMDAVGIEMATLAERLHGRLLENLTELIQQLGSADRSLLTPTLSSSLVKSVQPSVQPGTPCVQSIVRDNVQPGVGIELPDDVQLNVQDNF